MTEGVAIPLVLAVTAFPLVRQGPQNDLLIRALLTVAIAMAWTDALVYLIRAIWLLTKGSHFYKFNWIVTLATVIVLPGPLAWLFWTCLPGQMSRLPAFIAHSLFERASAYGADRQVHLSVYTL
jgi:hypothetical protein